MFNYNNGFQQSPYSGGNSFQPSQQPFLPSRMDYMQSMQPQPSGIQARPVTGREEAVAATVFPGTPVLFLDRAHGAVYYKAIDPQMGAAEFVDFIVARPVQPAQPQPSQAPQYATLADIEALRGEMASLRDMIPTPTARRAKGADTE